MTETDKSKHKENIRSKSIVVQGKGYSYNFSRGLLAHSLELRGLALDEAYRLARKVYRVLVSEGISNISEDDLHKYVREMALAFAGEDIAFQYNLIEHWHGTSTPLVILISGARGTGTSYIGERIAKKLAIKQIVSTNIVNQILKKTISPELAPELHSKSYLAFQNLRPIYSVLYDKVLIGYEEHSRFISESIEALIRRAMIEGLSIVVRGDQIIPRFLSNALIDHPNVIYVVLRIENKKIHEQQFLKKYKGDERTRRKEFFPAIRKIHDYLVEEAKNREHIIIDCEDPSNAISKINDLALSRLSSIFPTIEDKSHEHNLDFDASILHS